MLRDFVEIVGIDPVSSFPILSILTPYQQFTVEETLTIPEVKPDVEQITTVMVAAKITNYRTIATPTGLKVIVNGELTQKVIYTADEPTQSIHSAHFTVPFCNFIEIPLLVPVGTTILALLASLGLTLDTVLDVSPNVIIEDLSVNLVDARTVKKCAILFTWVTVSALLTPYLPPV